MPIKNYRKIGQNNGNMFIGGESGNSTYDLRLSSKLYVHAASGSINPSDQINFENTTYTINSLEIIDRYSQGNPIIQSSLFQIMKDISGINRSVNGLTFKSAYLTVGYTTSPIDISNTNVMNIKASNSVTFTWSTPSNPERSMLISSNGSFSPSLGDINEIGIFVEFYDNGTSGSSSTFLLRHLKCDTFNFTTDRIRVTLSTDRSII